jgi:AcrR family transcriptional regulator
MATRSARSDPEDILDEVIGLLEECGYDGWQLRDLAQRSHASLATVYKHFPSRDELIVAAVERWMNEHIYQTIRIPSDDMSLSEALMDMFHKVFEPWERHPIMLRVFVRARFVTGGDRLLSQGVAAVEPFGRFYADKLDPTFARDLSMILNNAVNGALVRYLNGEIEITDILPNLERTVYWLNALAVTMRPEPTRRKPGTATRTTTNRQRRSPSTAKRG